MTFINTARGAIINSPLMQLAHQSNIVLTPHIAWVSQQAIQRLANQLIDNIEKFKG